MSSTERWRRHKEKAHPKNTKKVEEARKRDRLRKQKAREEAHPEKMEEDKTRDRLHKQKVRSSLTFEEKAQINAKRRDIREKRTPEEVVNENAEMKDRVQGLRKARRVIELSQAGKFDTTKLWEVPGRDYLFTNFEDDLQSSVLLWHANTGSWWGREPKMCIAWLHFYRELGRELDPDFYKEPDPEPDPEASADAADVTEHPSEDEEMDDGCNEIRETEGLGVLEDVASVTGSGDWHATFLTASHHLSFPASTTFWAGLWVRTAPKCPTTRPRNWNWRRTHWSGWWQKTRTVVTTV